MPSDENPLSKVAEPTASAAQFIRRAALPRTLMGGTQAMRAAGRKYLPQNPSEHPAQYEIRLNNTYLFNAYERAVQMLVGKVFADPVTISSDAHERIVEWSNNIDLEGRDLTTFGEEWLKESIMTGRASVIVDITTPIRRTGTLEDDIGMRPYLSLVPGDSIIGWRAESYNGVQRLVQIRILESVEVPDARSRWGTEVRRRVRVYYAGMPGMDRRDAQDMSTQWARFEVYEERTMRRDDGSEEKTWVGPIRFGSLRPHVDIPIVTHFTSRTGFFSATPPMDDLAWKNVEHWNSSSEQRNILHAARVPILFGKGFSDDEKHSKKVIGSMVGWFATNEGAGLTYVETSSNGAMESGFKDLEMIKEDMSTLAMRPLLQRPTGSETALAAALESAEADSRLEAWARSLANGYNDCLDLMSVWKDLGASGTVVVNTDFGLSEMGREAVEQAYKARQLGDISRKTYWRILDNHEVLPEGFDAAEEEVELQTEFKTKSIAPNEVNTEEDDERTALGLADEPA